MRVNGLRVVHVHVLTSIHVHVSILTGIPMKTCTNILSRELRGTTHSGFSTVKILDTEMITAHVT